VVVVLVLDLDSGVVEVVVEELVAVEGQDWERVEVAVVEEE
jgi:hypothetical protein